MSHSLTSLNLEKSASYFPNQSTEALRDPTHSSASLFEQQREIEQQADRDRADADAATHEEVQRLMRETQMWRIANSAQWVVWGILQATMPGLSEADCGTGEGQADGESKVEFKVPESLKEGQGSDPLDAEAKRAAEDAHDKRPEDHEEAEEEFDCLAYSRDRALFFWGDCLQMGLVREGDLGEELASAVKIVPY